MSARSVVSPARLASRTQSPSRTPRCSASCGWISSRSSLCQTTLSVRRVCAPTLYWLRMRPGAFVGRDIFGEDEFSLAADKAADMHNRRAFGRLLVAGPLHRAQFVELGVGHTRKCWRQRRDLIHDLRGVIVVHLEAHRLGKADG